MTTSEITIKRPDDFHCHFRDGDYLVRTVQDEASQFARAIAMPNLKPPVIALSDAIDYRERILKHVPKGCDFTPLMTLYLSESMTPNDIAAAKQSGVIFACKLYPAGATTNAQAGVSDIQAIYPLLDQMQADDLPLCIHGESITKGVDVFDREKVFIEETLQPILKHFPKLRVVLEHISTKTAVEFVLAASNNLAATITPHHLHYNRNAIFENGIRPHYYCLPLLKRSEDQIALRGAATSGHHKFFLGTDSAPHTIAQKESSCGCAGIYNAHAALPLFTRVFEEMDALSQLEKFASKNGAKFYRLPLNKDEITLVKKPWQVPATLTFGQKELVPMGAGETLSWQVQ